AGAGGGAGRGSGVGRRGARSVRQRLPHAPHATWPLGTARRAAARAVRGRTGMPRTRLRRPLPAPLALRADGRAALVVRRRLMDPALFLADLAAKPETLARLAATLRSADPFQPLAGTGRVQFLGRGSSRYACGMAAARLRRAGIDATADYASAPTYPPGEGLLVVAVSATGGSREVLDALSAYPRRIVLTNDERSAVARG